MYLKSLTLKGFKSFASSTTLEFEKGITCVVGPNGSGKSNVVDAMAWVMGEQGAKALRGASMQDVIFAGTATRPPLGRAEVSLTIDNTSGALPIDYTEVTITRTLFRNGTSEYAINGEQCRLLDIQELLSDTGMGRQMHVIVGQNQLGRILRSSAEDRRAMIEEAAGVLKYRRRKEKALRKLESTDANVQRLTDLTAEIRRQLKPLGRQAEAARRAAIIQADARDARLRLYADDLVSMQELLAREVADEAALRERRAEVESALAEMQAREAMLETQQREAAPLLQQASDVWFSLAGLRERTSGLSALAAERLRLLTDEVTDDQPVVRDPAELDAAARAARAQEHELGRQVEQERAALAQAVRLRADDESMLGEHDARVERAARAVADRREHLARLAGLVSAAESRVEARTVETDRLAGQHQAALDRATAAQAAFRELESTIADLDEGEVGLDAEHSRTVAALTNAQNALAAAEDDWRALDKRRGAAVARVEALKSALEQDGSLDLIEASQTLSAVLGPLADLVTVEAGAEAAVAAALGPLANAVAVSGRDAAAAAMRTVRGRAAGRASLLVLGVPAAPYPAAPAGARWVMDCVAGDAGARAALSHLLRGYVLVAGVDDAERVVAADPTLVAVTGDGDVLASAWASAGDTSASRLQMQAAYDAAAADLADLTAACERAQFEISAAQAARESAQEAADRTLARLHESDATMSAVAEQLGEHSSAIRNAQAEAQRIAQAMSDAAAARDEDAAAVVLLQEQLQQAQAEPEVRVPDEADRVALAEQVESARAAEVEARLAVRTTEERMRAAAAQADSFERAARESRSAIDRAVRRKEQRERGIVVARAVATGAQRLGAVIEATLARAEADRDRGQSESAARESELSDLRQRLRDLTAEHERLTDSVHRDDLARAEQRMRIEALQDKVLDEYGIEAETFIIEYGPQVLVPASQTSPADEEQASAGEPYPYVRHEQERRLAEAERGLALLGRVNPLALEEYAAMEERHKFLTDQLEDLRRGRADLMTIIAEVDERVREVFNDAFQATAAHFADLFPRMFPGGEGRMYLSDPEDLLSTGVEIEAKPAGKKPSTLTLLSGGESSMAAVAFLVAIFKARPSPFYVLDEVEAALDDVNLGRLIDVMRELKAMSQLIVITHQKRTMEVADALYGVSMRGDGLSVVIGQRLSDVHDDDREPAAV